MRYSNLNHEYSLKGLFNDEIDMTIPLHIFSKNDSEEI